MSDIRLLANELSRLGTRHVFGIPGEGSSLELLSELERLGCGFHSVGHEAVAALMAGGYGRVSGMPGVALSIKGPGFSNMLAGIASNWLDRNPVLSLSESYGPGSSSDRMHKRLAQADMVTPVVKAYADNPSPELIPQLWHVCVAEEPGPVHVDISTTMTGRTFESWTTEQDLRALSRTVSDRIQGAQKPVVIAGALATRRTWREKLAHLKIPVFTTVAGKGALDEAQPWSAGVFTHAGGPIAPERAILLMTDLVVGLGLRTTEILDVQPFGRPLILLDELAERAKGFHPTQEVIAKEEGFLEVLDLLASKEWGHTELHHAKARLSERLKYDRWMPAAVFKQTQAVLPTSTRFVLDTGNFCTIGEHVLTAHGPAQVTGSASGRSMGVALPTGIGAAFGARGTPMVIVVGDGGVRMYPESITLAVRERLRVLVMMISDGYYASIRQGAVRKSLPQNPLKLDSSCWLKVFESFGCPSERVESLPALERVLRAWMHSSGPLFLELRFDAEDYLQMTEGIR